MSSPAKVFSSDAYQENPNRVVLLRCGRYRVVHSLASNSYSLWYSGNIIQINNREDIVNLFRDKIEEIEGMKS